MTATSDWWVQDKPTREWHNINTGEIARLDNLCASCPHTFGKHTPLGDCVADPDCDCLQFHVRRIHFPAVRNRILR